VDQGANSILYLVLFVNFSVSALFRTDGGVVVICVYTLPPNVFDTACATISVNVVTVVALFSLINVKNSVTTVDIRAHTRLAFNIDASPVWLYCAVLITSISIHNVSIVTSFSAKTRVVKAISATRSGDDDTLFNDFVSEVKHDDLHFRVVQSIN
jgi:SNF family Na+-dependent transporter